MVGWLTASVIVNIILALLCLYFWHKGYEREEECKKYYRKQIKETITFMEKDFKKQLDEAIIREHQKTPQEMRDEGWCDSCDGDFDKCRKAGKCIGVNDAEK